ncbi:MAG: c-type cytochrome [Chitinophagaceae bacterium]|nr:c-type cytochrome [Chitinophagaceae bacterium]
MKTRIVTALVIATSLFYIACGGGGDKNASSQSSTPESETGKTAEPSNYDPNRGEGKFDESNVAMGPLDAAMASKGKSISETKCFSCHKTSEEKLVGPGWKGVTTRRSGHWIMNFITNPDPMIDKDPEVQAQLELCLVRMPNQNLAEQEARDILEFMRQNDGAK